MSDTVYKWEEDFVGDDTVTLRNAADEQLGYIKPVGNLSARRWDVYLGDDDEPWSGHATKAEAQAALISEAERNAP